MRIESQYATYDNVFLLIGSYLADGSLNIRVCNYEDGAIATITKCLCDFELEPNENYIDTNNCPWLIDFIEEYGLGKLTGKTGESGYCTYPVVRFDMDVLKKYAKDFGG